MDHPFEMSRASLQLTGLLICAAMAGCAAQDMNHAAKAATTPLQDLNLIKEEIPLVLLQAQAQPYAIPTDTGCAHLQAQIQALDEVLGPDLDTPATAENPGLIERGAGEVKASLIKAIGRTTEGAVPFRSWVRKLSGAERHARHVVAAITAGSIRRAFLKGVHSGLSCG